MLAMLERRRRQRPALECPDQRAVIVCCCLAHAGILVPTYLNVKRRAAADPTSTPQGTACRIGHPAATAPAAAACYAHDVVRTANLTALLAIVSLTATCQTILGNGIPCDTDAECDGAGTCS